MKKIPKNKFTERLTNIYNELHLDSEKQFLADIVVSNFIEIDTDELYPFYDCGYGISAFADMMDMLSQSDDFMNLLSENDSIHIYVMLKQILDKNDGIKYDTLNELFSIIPLSPSDPVLKEDVALALSIDSKIAELSQTESWHNYLSKIGLYKDYKTLINYKV